MNIDRIVPSSPLAVAIATSGIGYLSGFTAIGLWFALYAVMFSDRRQLQGIDALFARIADSVLLSPAAMTAGKRTFTVYLTHFPIMQLILWGLAVSGVRSPWLAAAVLLLVGFPATFVAAELLHRYVEVPGMRLGKALASKLQPDARMIGRPSHQP